MLLLLLALLQTAPALPEGAALKAEIAAADALFFRTYFESCDPARLTAMVTEDFEMFHDKGGFVFAAALPFVEDYAKDCEAKKKPDSWRSRRVLVAESLRVDPVPGYGAIEEGDHLFYERKGDGPEKLAGSAHFVQVWKRGAAGWQLARVISYAHRKAE
jgi:hypothetical protein